MDAKEPLWALRSAADDAAQRARPLREAGRREQELAGFIARQIEVEQTLTSSRMTWNLTFQGFAIAGFALLSTATSASPARFSVQLLVAMVAFAIAFATWRGIIASQRQRTYLKQSWVRNGLSEYYPEPFSDSTGSTLGRSPAQWICWALMGMWTALLPLSIIAAVWPGPDKAIRIEVAQGAALPEGHR